jgi:site-specific DNA-methyltransferase (adenine-specific)
VIAPYYADDTVRLYLGDCREVLPNLGEKFDAAIVDPPYGYTSLDWDEWPDGWLEAVAEVTSSMWCFGSLRMFMAHGHEFAPRWRFSHDIVWEKHNGSGFHADRIRCVHEIAAHWYRGRWKDIYHQPPVTMSATRRATRRKGRPAHTGHVEGSSSYVSDDGGPRLLTSVIRARSMHGRAIHPTEKPVAILTPLIEYAVPLGGLVVDPMAGSCSTAVAAKLSGRRAVCIEAREDYLEVAARRLDQGVLNLVNGDVK